MPYHSAWGF